jgi:acetyltransferase-like isoleucine patch superfamily enzyme
VGADSGVLPDFAPLGVLGERITIGDNVTIGSYVVIQDGATLGREAIVGAAGDHGIGADDNMESW